VSTTDAPSRPPALLFGIPIADLTMDATIALVGDLVERGRSSGRTHQIATTNVDFLVNALDEPELRTILQSADACLADGMPVVWGASLLGMPIRERVAGADLVPLLVEASVTTGWRVHVFGSSAATAERARALFAARHPGAAFTVDPGPIIADPTVVDDTVLDAISAVDPDVLCVALGNPKQERFIHAHRKRLGVPVMIGVGGSLDLLVGERRRAPRWMQRTGTEWIARLAQEPGRLGGRYAHDIRVFGPRLARERREVWARRTDPGLSIEPSERTVEVRVQETGDPTSSAWERAIDRLHEGSTLELRAGTATAIRDRALAVLIGLVQTARRTGAHVRWLDDPSALAAALRQRDIPADLIGAV
jgi:N-acetylglucosaminyldiphosphoundecaprenol N-acetyl-beta-D-mannosaminyltransferase